MKVIGLVFLLAAVASCTKQNPNLCCTDAADCMAQGLSNDSQCGEGLLCRGHQCIAVTCGASSDCDASAPYCVASACSASCMDDTQCPGYGQASVPYCVAGSCVECRSASDCSTSEPVCGEGMCRRCERHDECDSGACADDGSCVSAANVSYVETIGSNSSTCTKASPCNTVARALLQTNTYIVVGSGDYSLATTLTANGKHVIIGRGTRPRFLRTTTGPIVTITNGDLTLDHVAVVGATASSNADDGLGISSVPMSGTVALTLYDVEATDNASAGVGAGGSTLRAVASTFARNGNGVQTGDGTSTFDRCLVTDNRFSGLVLDGGLYTLTNNFIVRNQDGWGVNLYTTIPGSRVEFNTIADNVSGINSTGAGFNCNMTGMTATFPNNIIVRNTRQTQGAACAYPSSLILDSDISAVKFKSADTQPFDYHLTSGSMAIDMATTSSLDHDYDGDLRPAGAIRDVGADEFVP